MLRILAILVTVVVAIFMAWVIGRSFTGWEADDGATIALSPDEVPRPLGDEEQATPITEVPDPGSGERELIQGTDPETNRVIQEAYYARMDPLSDGEYEVTGPIIRLHPAPNRSVVMTADAGHIIAPDRIPQSGRFTGDVTVRLFEAPVGQRPVIARDSPDLALTIRLDEAQFDTQVGMIESDGSVIVQSREAEFKGRQLRLVFNEPRQRVDYLEITEGEYLKYRRPRGGAASEGRLADRVPAARDRPPLNLGASDRLARSPAESDRPEQTDEQADRTTYYRAVFSDEVTLTSDDRRVLADRMTAYFAFQRADDSETAAGRGDRWLSPMPARHDLPRNASVDTGTGLALEDRANVDELVLTWTGKMVITPEPDRPAKLAGPEDLWVVFAGSPVRAEGEEGERMIAAGMEYLDSRAEITATGSAAFPLRMRSDRLGRITADDFTLRLDTGQGTLRGEGLLAALEPEQRGADDAPDEGTRGLPPGFTVRWADRLDLELATGDEPDGLKRATFHGAVEVDDRRFDLNADQLAVVFDQVDARGDRQLSRIHALDAVRVRGTDGELDADRMRIDVALDDEGRLRPRHLDAAGNVRIADAKQQIEAQLLLATFQPEPEGADGADEEDDGLPGIQLATVDAREQVGLNLADGTRIQTDRLEADNRRGTATLTGEPVVIHRETSQLRVPRLEVRRDGNEAVATGAGSFALNEPPDEANPAGRRIDVTWTDRMTYSDREDQLTVHGSVRARAQDKPRERNELDAEQLIIDLVDRAAVERTRGEQAAESAILESLKATGNVRLLSSRFRDDAMREVETRLRISGEQLTFDNVAERARVDQAGTLLIEDYRPVGDDRADTDRVAASAVKISGRGQTVFTWTGSMELDGARTDAIFQGDVHMTHKPAGRNAVVELKTDELVADMEGLGGLEALNTTDELEIRRIRARGSTQLSERGEKPEQTRLISTHLLDYDGAAHRITLQALPGHRVEIIRLDEPRPVRASRILWHLETDRVEIQDSGY